MHGNLPDFRGVHIWSRILMTWELDQKGDIFKKPQNIEVMKWSFGIKLESRPAISNPQLAKVFEWVCHFN